jgi:hypothetical protein
VPFGVRETRLWLLSFKVREHFEISPCWFTSRTVGGNAAYLPRGVGRAAHVACMPALRCADVRFTGDVVAPVSLNAQRSRQQEQHRACGGHCENRHGGYEQGHTDHECLNSRHEVSLPASVRVEKAVLIRRRDGRFGSNGGRLFSNPLLAPAGARGLQPHEMLYGGAGATEGGLRTGRSSEHGKT